MTKIYDLDGELLWKDESRDTLIGADLHNVVLTNANLSYANLPYANLRGADLCGAYLRGADLCGANLSGANLSGANLRGADLRGADLRGVDLRGADLRYANLRYADLYGAKLTGADLTDACLIGAKNIPDEVAKRLLIAPEGVLIGWKKLLDGTICKLEIPADARRFNATGRKCRAEFAKVLEGEGISRHDSTFKYVVGEIVRPREPFDPDRWNECSSGIHFFLTREEAEDY